jgi:hypothetical protein
MFFILAIPEEDVKVCVYERYCKLIPITYLDVSFYSNTSRIGVRFYNPRTHTFEGLGAAYPSLPLNCTTRVRIEVVGRYLMVFQNNTLSGMRALNFTRFFGNTLDGKPNPLSLLSGNATVMLSGASQPAANASISSIRMSPLISSIRVNSTGNSTGIPEVLLIYNSLFDDCSKEEGADAGCGHNLQCNAFADGKASCGPVKNLMVKLLHRLDDSEAESIIVSQRHQTCESSSRYNNRCAKTDTYSLTCTPVTAIVKGQVSEKSICLADFEIRRLQKRPVRATFWYSGFESRRPLTQSQNLGTNWKAI